MHQDHLFTQIICVLQGAGAIRANDGAGGAVGGRGAAAGAGVGAGASVGQHEGGGHTSTTFMAALRRPLQVYPVEASQAANWQLTLRRCEDVFYQLQLFFFSGMQTGARSRFTWRTSSFLFPSMLGWSASSFILDL